MKKITSLLLFSIIIICSMSAKADINALSTKSIKYYGIGVLNMPKSYTVYRYPKTDSEILRHFNYETLNKTAIVNSVDMRKVSYVTYIPSANIALLAVENETGTGWYNVYLSQLTGETGWVYNEREEDFYTYKSLFDTFGKKYGIRMFSNLPKDKKVLYAKPNENSQHLDQLTYPKYIGFSVISGNWILLTVNDMSKHAKVGWFKWRNDDGTLNMFPFFKEY